MVKGENRLWKCKCGVENEDASPYCTGCGLAKSVSSGVNDADPNHWPVSKTASPGTATTLYSEEAKALNSFAEVGFIITVVFAIVFLIFFSVGEDRWGDPAFSGTKFLIGLLWSGGITLAGYVGKIVLKGFSIIVEASYRRIRRS